MNKSQLEKYEKSFGSLNDIIEEKRAQMIEDLRQRKNILASEIEILKKQLANKQKELSEIDKTIKILNGLTISSSSIHEDLIGRIYDNKREPQENTKRLFRKKRH